MEATVEVTTQRLIMPKEELMDAEYDQSAAQPEPTLRIPKPEPADHDEAETKYSANIAASNHRVAATGFEGLPPSMIQPQFPHMSLPNLPPPLPPHLIDSIPVSQLIIPPPLTRCYAHPANVPSIPALPIPIPAVNQMDLAKKAKMQLYQRDLVKLTSRYQLVEYMLKQSNDPIPSSDAQLLFNDILKTKKGIIGADQLAQVVCYNQPDLESYLCLMCQHWTTASDMFNHLKSNVHRTNYMLRKYKTKHAKVVCEDNDRKQTRIIREFAHEIAENEGHKKCQTRMRTVLNEPAIAQIWPEYFHFLDESWKKGGIDYDEEEESDDDEGKAKEAKPDVKESYEDEFGEPQDLKPDLNAIHASSTTEMDTSAPNESTMPPACNTTYKIHKNRVKKDDESDLEDGEIFDSDDDEEDEKNIKAEPSSSIDPASYVKTEAKSEKIDIDDFQKPFVALVLIRQEANDLKNFSRPLMELICNEIGINLSDVFSQQNMEDVSRYVGDEDSTYATFQAILSYYHKRQLLIPLLPNAAPPAIHASVLLTNMGVDKQTVAFLLRTIATYKINQKRSSPETYIVEEQQSVNKIERDKHGSIIHKNYQPEFVFPKDQPLTVRAQPRKRYHPYLRPNQHNDQQNVDRDGGIQNPQHPSSSHFNTSELSNQNGSSNNHNEVVKREIKEEKEDGEAEDNNNDNDTVIKVENSSDWDAASNILDNLFNES